jgi:hypothetical protein
MESEFFGYRKGAFTGADSDRDGFFQAANGGTLFLDEVADLPLAMQVKLLRAIQEKRVRKVGCVTEEAVDMRIICATHRNLRECVDRGSFRQDLYYRLNVIELRMPPLRERMEDIAPLVIASILQKLCGESHPRAVACGDQGTAAVFLPRQCAGTGKHPGAGHRPVYRRSDRSGMICISNPMRWQRRSAGARQRNARRLPQPSGAPGDS